MDPIIVRHLTTDTPKDKPKPKDKYNEAKWLTGC